MEHARVAPGSVTRIDTQMELRPYQRDGLEAIRAALLRGVWSQVLVWPTGAGKTVAFAYLPIILRDWLAKWPRWRMLILAHREELLDQAAMKLRAINPSLMIGIEQGARRSGAFDDVVIASVQTLTAASGRRLHALRADDFRIVIVDECHHSRADTYETILQHFNVIPPNTCRPTSKSLHELERARASCQQWWGETPASRLLLGVTATPNRADGLGLEWSFQSIVYEKTLRYMIEREYLVGPRGYVIDGGTNLDDVKIAAGDFQIGDLAAKVNTPERNALAVAAWLARSHGMQTLAFTVDVQHARDLHAAFVAQGVNADWASGDRREPVQRFRDGAIDVLCSCSLIHEGFDHPPAGCALMMRPTKSQTLYSQQIGRVLRPSPGKDAAIIIDIVDVSRRHALIAAGDLFGLPRKFDAQGQSLLGALQRVERAMEETPQANFTGATTLDQVEQRIRQVDLWTVREPDELLHATLLWMADSPMSYRIGLPRRDAQAALTMLNDRVDVRQDLLGRWLASFTDVGRHECTPIVTTGSLVETIRKAEAWIAKCRPDVTRMKARHAAWREKPASSKQIALLRKLRAPMNVKTITRGAASTLLDQYFARRPRREAQA